MNYHNITKDDMKNGDGLRVVLWVSGCDHHCKGCHNPQTWEFDSGIPFDTNAMNELLNALDKPYIQGLTLTGGNPIDSGPEILAICSDIKKRFPNKDIWLYSGYTFDEIKSRAVGEFILEYIDVLVDGPYIEEQRDITLPFRGSKNQRLIDVKETLKQGQIIQYKIN